MNKGKCIGLVTVALLFSVGGLHADLDAGNADGAQRVLEWSMAGNDAVPNIGLPPGRLVTVSFHDTQGAPWPAVQVMGPEADWLSYRPASEHRHVVFLESRAKRGAGNLVALLDGLAAPVHLGLVADAAKPRRF